MFTYSGKLWCIPPSVVFNGVATVLDTGSTALNHPRGVIVDNAGNIYISDTAHNQIVKETPAGSASALSITGLSTGLSGPEGLALDGSGNLYIADTVNNRIVVVTSAGAGSAVDLGGVVLNSPQAVATDGSGNLYIADTGNNRIVKLPSGGAAAVLTITGLGTALSAPVGLSVDPTGNLYIADGGNNRIVKVTAGGRRFGIEYLGTGNCPEHSDRGCGGFVRECFYCGCRQQPRCRGHLQWNWIGTKYRKPDTQHPVCPRAGCFRNDLRGRHGQ
jgi:sugar lactone lactonase YvrE